MKNATTKTSFSVPTPYEMGCLTLAQQRDWNLVVRCLSGHGALYHWLDEYTRRQAWLMADGFGKVSLRVLNEELCWDWSHVRDSSEPAVARMAAFLREAGCEDAPVED